MKFKVFVVLIASTFCIYNSKAQSTISLQLDTAKYTINKDIYGHFAEHLGRCICDGIWVGEKSSIPNINGYRKDVIVALKDLHIPLLR